MDVLIKEDLKKASQGEKFSRLFKELMNDEDLQLPLREYEEESYNQALERVLDYYCNHLGFLSESSLLLIRDNVCKQIIDIANTDDSF